MKVEGWLFAAGFFFFAIAAIVYGLVAGETVGVVALAFTAGLAFLVGYYLLFTARRIDVRPEDRKDAEIADGAGELGFFSPASYWPFGLALSAGLMGLALAFYYPWLIAIAGAALLITIGGLLFEYYVGQNASS